MASFSVSLTNRSRREDEHFCPPHDKIHLHRRAKLEDGTGIAAALLIESGDTGPFTCDMDDLLKQVFRLGLEFASKNPKIAAVMLALKE